MKTAFPRAVAALSIVLVTAVLMSGCEQSPPPPVTTGKKTREEPVKTVAMAGSSKNSSDAKVKPKKTAEPKKEDEHKSSTVVGEEPPMQPSTPVFKEPPAQDGWKRSKPLGENVWLETKGDARRVLVASVVCLREGNLGLECLLCKRGTKEHESILVTTADARIIDFALQAANFKKGTPVQFDPKFVAPTGDKVKVTLLFENKGKWVTTSAQSMIRNVKTKKDIEFDWVFAGSKLYQQPGDPNAAPIYLANTDGAYISIANVSTAMLDLPIDSPKSLDNRIYEPNTPNIPALDTSVTIILEPIAKK